MTQHSQVSDDCVDQLVELLFLAMPAVDSQELVAFLNCIVRIVSREARRAVAEERARWRERVRSSCNN